MNGHVRWAGEPDMCRCPRMIVDTIEETLTCPGLWLPLHDGRWAHILGGAR